MHFEMLQTMTLIFVVNITAAVGAFLFGYVQDWLGHRRTLALTLLGWLAMTWIASATTSVAMFWVAANLAGICMGSSQSAGRAMAGALAPANRRAEFYGLWILATQLASVVGPLTYGLVMLATGNDHRVSIFVTGVFFLAGLLLVAPINMRRGQQVAAASS
jgi:UMF1 family MFS transporter